MMLKRRGRKAAALDTSRWVHCARPTRLLWRWLLLLLWTLLLCSTLEQSAGQEFRVVGVVPPASLDDDSSTTTSGPYFPHALALSSVLRLAAERIAEDGSLLLFGSMTVTVVEADSAAAAAAQVCSSLVAGTEDNATTVAVRVIPSV